MTDDQTDDTELDLEPMDENPLDQGDAYNPFHHAYPMRVNTIKGELEIFVKFMPLQGKNIQVDLINTHQAFQIPVSVEDVTIQDADLDHDQKEEAEDKVNEQIIQDEINDDQNWYIVPTIVKATWPAFDDDPLGAAAGLRVSKEETAHLVSPDTLLERIQKYRDEVSKDDRAPAALLDLLLHFDPKAPSNVWGDNWPEEETEEEPSDHDDWPETELDDPDDDPDEDDLD